MTISNASSLLAQASACRWSQLLFAKHWNELRQTQPVSDDDLLNAFWSVGVLKKSANLFETSNSNGFDDDLSFLDALEFEIDRELVTTFVCFLITSTQISPHSVCKFFQDRGGLMNPEHHKLHIEVIGDILKSLIISLLSFSAEMNSSQQKGEQILITRFKLLLELVTTMLTSISEFLSTHYDFNNQVTCLRLTKWIEAASIIEKSAALKVYCQFNTPKATDFVENWKRLQNRSLSMSALDRNVIAIKENLITMSQRWVSRSRQAPFSGQVTPTKGGSSTTPSPSFGEPEFCSLFCGSVDYLYCLEFGSTINRFSSSEFIMPLLRSAALSMTLFIQPADNESAITQQISSRYLPLLNHIASSLACPNSYLFELIEHSVKTAVQQSPIPPPGANLTKIKFSANNFSDTRPNYALRVFQLCRMSCLAKSMNISPFNGEFVSVLITNAGRDMSRSEFEDFVERDLIKNLHVAPFLTRTETTRLQLVLAERATKEDNHLALGLLAAIDLFRCYLLNIPGAEKPSPSVIPEGAVGSFLENFVNKRIKSFSNFILTTEGDDWGDHHQDDNEGHLPDLDTFMSTLPDSLAESVGIGFETASRLLFLLGKADSSQHHGVIKRLVFANPTLAFILWMLVDEKLRRRQIAPAKSSECVSSKRRRSGEQSNSYFLQSISEMLKNDVSTFKSPFNSIFMLLITLSFQVRSLAISLMDASPSDAIKAALKHPTVLNHFNIMRQVALPDGMFKPCNATAEAMAKLFQQVLASGSCSSSSGQVQSHPHSLAALMMGSSLLGISVDTTETYRNFLAFALPMIAGLDSEAMKILLKKWYAPDGMLFESLCGQVPDTNLGSCQLSFLMAAHIWNFSFFIVLMATNSSAIRAEELKETLAKFFEVWHLSFKIQRERFRFVAMEMFFAELMFFANSNVCRLVAASLPNDFILNFVISTAPNRAISSVEKLLQLKRRVIGRLFALDDANRFNEEFCIRAVCSLSPFDNLG